MANGTNTPFGFIPIRTLQGDGGIPLRDFTTSANTAGALGRHDLVSEETAGNLERSAAGNAQIVGSTHGHRFTNADGYTDWSPYNTATRVSTVSVAYHPDNVYLAQGDVTACAVADAGAQCDHVDAAPSATSFDSQQYLDIANLGTGAASFRILRLYRAVDNAAGDTYGRYEALLVEHAWRATTGI